ncbi:MAG: response regulator [Spirochaetes bacterium]|nr:response regulator [Spirochaetota bacterium]
MDTISVLIVEDDFRVADINKQFTEAVPGFSVVEVAKNGMEAISFISSKPVELVILDIYLPDIYGIEVLKEIRKKELSIDVILITAAHDRETVENSIRFGVFDYIIKPFNFERYKEALLKYQEFKVSLNQKSTYNQNEVDKFTAFFQGKSENNLPKGITSFTLNRIQKAIKTCGKTFTMGELLEKVSLSRITTRRYLEFLCDSNLLTKSLKYTKIGRPTILYSKK